MSQRTIRRMLETVEQIRRHPKGDKVADDVLDLLRRYVKQHPEAREVRAAIEMIERERAPARASRPRPTFGEFTSQWIAARKSAGASMGVTGALVRQRLMPAFGDRELASITAAEIRRWVDSRRGTASFDVERDLLRSILVAATAEGLIKRIPGDEHLH